MIGTTDNNSDCDYRVFILPEDLEELKENGLVVGDYVQRDLKGLVERGLKLRFDESFRGYVDMKPKEQSVNELSSLEIIVGKRGLSRLGEMLEHYEARSDWVCGRKVHFHYVSEDNWEGLMNYNYLCLTRDSKKSKG